MQQTAIVYALVVLVIALSGLGVWTNNAAVLTMAATVIAGMLALIQIRPVIVPPAPPAVTPPVDPKVALPPAA